MAVINIDDLTLDKVRESQYLRLIDTTPTATNPTWVLIGVGVDSGEAGVDYNRNVERLKWIIHDNASTNVTGSDKQMSVPQKTYKGDPCFAYVNGARRVESLTTRVLEIDSWDEIATGQYKADMSNGTIVVTSYNGDELDWDLYFDGDATEGSVTIVNNKPVFTPTASL